MNALGSEPVIEQDLVRHLVLNSLRAANHRYRSTYGEMVIAVDTPRSWRKQKFPYYKANRDIAKAKSFVDWTELSRAIKVVHKEIDEFLPWQVINIDGAEADDIIGTLARHAVSKQEQCLILSGDKDFIQLQMDNIFIKQYDNVRDKWVTANDPKRYLFEHVMKGDVGDGIPNIFSADDHYIAKTNRAKPITQKKLELWWSGDMQEVLAAPGFKRNVELIDLRRTPPVIQGAVLDKYKNSPKKGKSKVLDYFIKNNLRQLTAQIGEF